MQVPQLIYLTAAVKLDGLDRLVAVRPDLVACIERSRLDPQAPKPPMRQVTAAQGPSIEATVVILTIGIQLMVSEPVQEVKDRVNEALEPTRPRRWWSR